MLADGDCFYAEDIVAKYRAIATGANVRRAPPHARLSPARTRAHSRLDGRERAAGVWGLSGRLLLPRHAAQADVLLHQDRGVHGDPEPWQWH
eukprot:2877490-Prymnesium_polylepis.1